MIKSLSKIAFFSYAIFLVFVPGVFAFEQPEQKVINNLIGGQKTITENLKNNFDKTLDLENRLRFLENSQNVHSKSVEQMIEAIDIKNDSIDNQTENYNNALKWLQVFGFLVVGVAIVLGFYKKGEIKDIRKEVKDETSDLLKDLGNKYDKKFGEGGKMEKKIDDFLEERKKRLDLEIDDRIEQTSQTIINAKIEDFKDLISTITKKDNLKQVKTSQEMAAEALEVMTTESAVGDDPRKRNEK